MLLTTALLGCGAAAGEAPQGAAASSATERTLQEPPDLQVGEWWTVEVVPALAGATYPTTLVVTGRTGQRASIGVPPAAFSHDFLVLHIPPLGDLDLETFGWRVMWNDFEALRFPLEPGRSWAADFHGREVRAEVTRVDGSRAYVTMEGRGERIELIYDAEVGMITDFREDALGLAFRVTGHGFDYRGDVLAFSGIELGLMASPPRAAPPSSEAGMTDGGSSVEVATGGSHGSLSLILWNVGTESEPGSYRITATAPDGATFDERFEPRAGDPSIAVRSFGPTAVNGTWQIRFEQGGPAGLLAELFTYDRTTLELGGGHPPPER